MSRSIDPSRLSTDIHYALSEQITALSPNRNDLLQQVVGIGGNATGYLYGGLTTAVGIRAALEAYGRKLSTFRDVLDFGCGSGRVLRWFGDIKDHTSLVGVDINEDAIDWCQKNIPFGNFVAGPYLPPLPFPDQSFGLIYGISVFTHLNKDYEAAWLAELKRLIRPDGLLLLTFHGSDKARRSLSTADYVRFKISGFLFKVSSGASVDGLPDFYQVAFHSGRYIEDTWGQYFHPRRYIAHGPMYEQTLAVLDSGIRRRAGPFPRFWKESTAIDKHPLACIDNPVIGTRTKGSMHIDGWAFYPDRTLKAVAVWIDGQQHNSCAMTVDQPGVRSTFGLSDNVLTGFRCTINTSLMSSGHHILWISDDADGFPLATTYFTV